MSLSLKTRQEKARASLVLLSADISVGQLALIFKVSRQTISSWLNKGKISDDALDRIEEVARDNGYWIWDGPDFYGTGDALDEIPSMPARRLESLSKQLHAVADFIGDPENDVKLRSDEFIAFFKTCERALRAHLTAIKKK